MVRHGNGLILKGEDKGGEEREGEGEKEHCVIWYITNYQFYIYLYIQV